MSSNPPQFFSRESTNRTSTKRTSAIPTSVDPFVIKARRFTVAHAVREQSRGSTFFGADACQEQAPSFQALIKLESKDGNVISFDSQTIDYPSLIQTAGVASTLQSSVSAIVGIQQRATSLDVKRMKTPDSVIGKTTLVIDEMALKSVVDIRPKTPFERVDVYTDSYPMLPYRKAAMRLGRSFRQLCRLLVGNWFFETFIILVILFNTVLLALEDPSYAEQPEPYFTMDINLLYIYTVEMGLKVRYRQIMAFGFVVNRGSYIRDPWNILDFVIVVTGWVEYQYSGSGVNLTALRALRILRPLRSVTRIHGMRVIFLSLIGSVKLLIGSMTLLFFFYLVVSIAALQMFMGSLRYRCMDLETGYIDTADESICGSRSCPTLLTCAKGMNNPLHGTTHFDNIAISMITIFQCVTLEGWVPVMNMLQKTVSVWMAFFFVPIIFLGAYFFMNMTLVAMKSSALKLKLEEALEAEAQAVLLKTTISPETIKSEPSKTFKMITDTDFFTLESQKDVKMRQNVMTVEPQELNPNLSFTSQEMILASKDDMSLSSPKYGEKQLITAESPLELSILPSIGQIVDDEDFPISFRNQGNAILRENPSFSEIDTSKKDVRGIEMAELPPLSDNSKSEPKSANENSVGVVSDPEVDLLKSPFFSWKRQQLKYTSDEDIAYQISEQWVLTLEGDTDIKGTQLHYREAVTEPKKYTFTYVESNKKEPPAKIDEKSSDESMEKAEKPVIVEAVQPEKLFKKFLQLSIRFTPKEAYKRLVPLARTIVHDHLSHDSLSTLRKEGSWSGSDIFPDFDTSKHMESINNMAYFLWKPGCRGSIQRFFYPFALIAYDKKYFESFMTLCVVLNTIILAINHYQIDQDTLNVLDNFNLAFTVVFAIEMCVKLMGMGITGYFRLKMNVFDCVIVVLSILELTLLANSGFNGLNAIRIFRAFRVLRVARLLRWMPYMQKIMTKIGQSAAKFMYLGMLLLLFIVIFALFGMQLFGGKFDMPDADRATYDNFNFAFLSTFQLLTMENWHNVLHNGMRAVGAQAAIYFVIWVFLGNFVMLNLFLAILLDAFEEDSEDPFQSIATSLSTQDTSMTRSTRDRKKLESIRKKIEEIEQESIQSASGSVDSVFDTPKAKGMYEGNQCAKSFFLFAQENRIRIFLMRVTTSGRFERFIMLLIALSSLKLIWETYLLKEQPGSVKLDISDQIDTVFTVLFAVELLMKSVSMGFVLDKGTYLREGWNILDCFIVTFSLIDLSVSSINIPIIKVFRLLRALRPLRFISHNVSMRIIVSALLESLSVLVHVTVVMLIVWLIFAILGVSLFAGKMYTCSIPTITTRAECEYYAGSWDNSPYHFDNVLNAMVTLFDLTSPENWNDTMYRTIDTTNKEEAMSTNASPVYGYYIVVFIIISNFFFLNLFLGVMFDKFEKAKRENTSISEMLLLPQQYRWIEMMKLVIKTKQKIGSVVVDVGRFRTWIIDIVNHWAFNAFIMACIMCNMIIMAMAYDEASPEYITTLENMNYSFTAVFATEAALKITGFGLSYFKDRWNQFDFFVVTMSLLDIILSSTVFSGGGNKMMTVGPQLARTLRVLRVSRMLRLIKSLQIMNDLIGMLALSLPAMVNVLALLVLVFVIFGVLGVFLFHTVETGDIVDEYNNFANFGMSVLILIRASTGEDWNYILHDCTSITNPWIAHAFFFSFVVITTFIMYNMFVMVMLQEYENYQNNPESSFKVFKEVLNDFNKAWNKAAASKNIAKLDSEQLFVFANEIREISTVREPNGLIRKDGKKETKYGIRKRLGMMGIIPDENDLVYYHDVLFKYVRLLHGIHTKARNLYSKKIIEKEELFYTKRLRKLVKMARMNSAANLLGKAKTDMKFFDILFLKTVFRSWKGWTARRRGNEDVSVTPPMSLNFPGANSERFDEEEEDEVSEGPEFLGEATLSREVRTSRMSTNFSKNRMDTQE